MEWGHWCLSTLTKEFLCWNLPVQPGMHLCWPTLESPVCHQGQGDVPRSVPVMDVNAEGDCPSSLAWVPVPGTPDCTPAPHSPLGHGHSHPCRCQHPQQLSRGGTQLGHGKRWLWLCTHVRLLRHQCLYSSVLVLVTDDAKDGFPSYFWSASVEQCFASGCQALWLVFCLALVCG